MTTGPYATTVAKQAMFTAVARTARLAFPDFLLLLPGLASGKDLLQSKTSSLVAEMPRPRRPADIDHRPQGTTLHLAAATLQICRGEDPQALGGETRSSKSGRQGC